MDPQAHTVKPPAWHEYALQEIAASSYKPNDFERKFLASIKERIGMRFQLTDKQSACLARIHEKATEIKRIPRRGR